MFFVIIRGPAGVGKSSIARELEKELKANYISFDEVMSKHHLDTIEGDGISTENFIKANDLVLEGAKKNLKKGNIVIFDGCFYREDQLKHLLENLPFKNYIFTLKAPMKICFKRNTSRSRIMSEQAIKEVHSLVSKKDFGKIIDTTGKSKKEVVKEIIGIINERSN